MSNNAGEIRPPWLIAVLEQAGAVLAEYPIRIVDVGASVQPPAACRAIAPVATYLGFDPDTRAAQKGNPFGFQQHVTIDKAVTSGWDQEVTFNLTSYPECSSVLAPKDDEARRYLFGGFFEVVGQAVVGATTLNEAIRSAGLPYVDWLKLDTQGTDLDLLRSLDASYLRKALVVDVEPGVSAFYVGENRLADVHDFMLSHGFWLADLKQQRSPRVSMETVDQLHLGKDITDHLAGNPFALELQYFRTIESWTLTEPQERDLVAYWLLAMTNGHEAFALEIAASGIKRGISQDCCRRLIEVTLSETKARAAQSRERFWGRFLRLVMPPIIPKAFQKMQRRLVAGWGFGRR